MAEQEDGLARLPAFDPVVVHRKRIGVIFEALDYSARAPGFTVADMVEPVNGNPLRDEAADHVHVAPAVFAQPVDDEQHGFYFLFGSQAW